MKHIGWIVSFVSLTFVNAAVVACSSDDSKTDDSGNVGDGGATNGTGDSDEPVEDIQADTRILFEEEITVTGENADRVKLEDGRVLIEGAGTYALQGSAEKVIVEVDTSGDVTLLLDGIDIDNSDNESPAILFSSVGKATVFLAQGTSNSLAGGSDDYDAALYSTASLTITGSGALHVNGNVQEGIASEMHLNVEGGKIWVEALDDGLNANNDNVSIITISGGYLVVNAGGDGIDSNGSIVITGGTVIAQSRLSSDPNTGLDADQGVSISGGTVVATGAGRGGMPGPGGPGGEATGNSTQLSVTLNQSVAAGGLLVLLDSNEVPVFAFSGAVGYESLDFSSKALSSGEVYSIYTGGKIEGSAADGLYSSITSYEPGTRVGTVSAQ